jgi:hypothetical protein
LVDRAKRYYAKEQSETNKASRSPVLIAYVKRTPKGKIRLHKIGIRFLGQKEESVGEMPPDDPRYVFESDYKVRKAAHDLVKKSAKFGRFYDTTARVFYEHD